MRRIIILNLNNSFTDLQFLFWYTQTNFFYVAMCRDKELEKLSLYARHLRSLLREKVVTEDDVDIENEVMSLGRRNKPILIKN